MKNYKIFLILFFALPMMLFSETDLEISQKLIEEKDYDKAIDILEELIKEENDSWEYNHWLGVAYIEKSKHSAQGLFGMFGAINQFKKGKKYLHKAIEINPDDVEGRELLVYSYHYTPGIAGGDKNKAIDQLNEIAKRSPKKAMKIAIELLQFDGEYEKAIEMCNVYVAQYPEDYQIYHIFGMIYQEKEDYPEAFEAFETIITADSTALSSLYQFGRTAVYSETNIDRGIECLQLYINSDTDSNDLSLDNAHWRLGTLYEIKGMYPQAKMEYEKAMRLDPKDKDFKNSIKKLMKNHEID